ncbi:hypothetical protein LX15_000373 [Streptoalloteichus tenebrarius]|uniref:Uncharacterized protein n=1 Tax=Streptoalloteichus tenebrarius (strain ATCC 17920 / DSM 40477 / JCM 4838 / CBS 697.72 / NBRC 16177 / NCIMB 11028 / NRRL B-12390 / A12253. 1 / ISP 5477) TaxID=1933 RepID=A0ABT1HMG6_STRSD|nr:hypothetical protein [Streptoalloteichus tenebrarius]MCP2256690.1 hypothetical protein [Streptoalloteichus tenebrarius]BFF00411.1 hypothetical protein GCM10020241_20860 [Streptoalloteichus tenebrarius]
MRLVRLGTEASDVGVDLRAALAACGRGSGVLGGVALLGVTPPDCPQALDAVLVLPRGVLVVCGVDLPNPALRLEAPLQGTWRVDGWELVRPDGPPNPASEALAAATAVSQRLQRLRAEPLPVSTVVAVGPYVERVIQPSADLHRGVRVLHPTATALLTAARELSTADRPCGADQALRLLTALGMPFDELDAAALAAEGFADSAGHDLAAASTVLIPRVTERPGPTAAPARPRRAPRWLPVAALAMASLLLVALVVTVATAGDDEPAPTPTAPTTQGSAGPNTTTASTVDGVRFEPRGTAVDADCAARAFGDVQVWLARNPCSRLTRGLFEAVGPSGRAAVSVAVLTFPQAATAEQFRGVASAPGNGGVSDLVREGKGWDGGPKSFSGAAFATARDGERVRLVEVVWLGEPSRPDDPRLRTLAERALRVPLPG